MDPAALRLARQTLVAVDEAERQLETRGDDRARAGRLLRTLEALAANWHNVDEDVSRRLTAVRNSVTHAGSLQAVSAALSDLEADVCAVLAPSQARMATWEEPGSRREAHDRLRAEVRSFVYKFPGRYLAQLHKILQQSGAPKASYSTVRSLVNELEAENQVITIGARQGTRRLCFPHYDRVRNPSDYYGGLWLFRTEVGADLSSKIENQNVLTEVYAAHHSGRKTVLVAPFGSSLKRGDKVEVLGTLVEFNKLAKEGHIIRPLGPIDAQDAVFIHHMKVHHGTGRPRAVDSPGSFLQWDPVVHA